MHEVTLDLEVTIFTLHDAERVDPQVVYAQKPCNSNGLLVVERQFLQRNSFVHEPLLILKGELQHFTFPPAMTHCYIWTLDVVLFRFDHAYILVVPTANSNESRGQERIATALLLPLSTDFVVLSTLQDPFFDLCA